MPGAEGRVLLGIPGSLRRGSFNRGLLHAVVELAPPEVRIELFELHDLPLYDGDVEAAGRPEPVRRLDDAIRAADGLLIATPEYNYGLPGVLKNAIDWASRPPRSSALLGKPVAMMGATPGRLGTVRAQDSLRQSLLFTRSPVVTHPQLYVAGARALFEDGRLTDEATRGRVAGVVAALVELVEGERRRSAARTG